jgi:pentatricopeptide repeat protein
VSDGHGGDDIEFLRQHCKDEKIEEAIACYLEMVEQLKYYTERVIKNDKKK